MVVVLVYYFQPQLLGISCTLVLAYKILLLGEDVGIAIIKHWTDIVLQHPFYDSAGTWGATAVKKNFSHMVLRYQLPMRRGAACSVSILLVEIFILPATPAECFLPEGEMTPHFLQKRDISPWKRGYAIAHHGLS
jgi:hypothetical protein